MPTQIEYVNQIIRMSSGGVNPDDSKYDFQYVTALLHQYRSVSISTIYLVERKINPLWTQKNFLPYDEKIQESDCYVKFVCPPMIALDALRDGFLYVGSKDGNCNYRRVNTRAEASNFNKHRFSKTNMNMIRLLYSDGAFEAYGNTMLQELMVDGIHANPEDVLTYNPRVDEYPIDERTAASLKEAYVNSEGKLIIGKPADKHPDGSETLEVDAIKKRWDNRQ